MESTPKTRSEGKPKEEKWYKVQSMEGPMITGRVVEYLNISKETLDKIPATSYTWPADVLSPGKIEPAGYGVDPESGEQSPHPARVRLGRRPTRIEFPSSKEEILARSEALASILEESGAEILSKSQES